MTEPITPDEAKKARALLIPSHVIDVFNGQIIINLQNGSAKVLQKDVVQELERLGIPSEVTLAEGYLNIEDIYRDRGWKVTYSRPAYNETGFSYFFFEEKS